MPDCKFNLNFDWKLASIAASAALSAIAIDVTAARATNVVWELEFDDRDGLQIGSGEFSYNGTTPFEETFFDPAGFPVLTIDASDNWFLLERFEANIGELSWTLADSFFSSPSWIPIVTNTGQLRAVSFDRFGSPSESNNWIFGDPEFLPVLAMFPTSFEQVPEAGGNPLSGTWQAFRQHGEGNGGGNGGVSVPESSPLFGLLAIAAGGSIFLKKTRAQNS